MLYLLAFLSFIMNITFNAEVIALNTNHYIFVTVLFHLTQISVLCS
jgi:hypothetical protein